MRWNSKLSTESASPSVPMAPRHIKPSIANAPIETAYGTVAATLSLGVAVAEGGTSRTGRIPVNTSGGLKSKGHPVGATGVGQICDLVKQIRCEAGDRQVPRHEVGLAQNLGGSGATCVVTIMGAA